MTNRNSLLKTKPFLLLPTGKERIWGGSRLKDDFGKVSDQEPMGESWECSTHPDGPSTVEGGKHAGRLLTEVLREHPEYLGTHPRTEGELPILIKFIDAKEDLSVQVHPDDAYAREHENGALGKTEMWYVLEAAKDAKLIYGLHHDTDRDTLRRGIESGTVEKYLQKVPVKKDDLFYIEAGTIHALGAGVLVVEIQESSNVTYRLYDYDRVDKDGNKRALHIDKALEVASLKSSAEPVQPLRVLKYRQGCASELLCRCKYFQVERVLLNTERCREMVSFCTDSLSFRALVCVGGCGTVFFGENEAIHFFKGDCIFVPANSVLMKFHGNAQILEVSC